MNKTMLVLLLDTKDSLPLRCQNDSRKATSRAEEEAGESVQQIAVESPGSQKLGPLMTCNGPLVSLVSSVKLGDGSCGRPNLVRKQREPCEHSSLIVTGLFTCSW
jgi:hypothetical protein